MHPKAVPRITDKHLAKGENFPRRNLADEGGRPLTCEEKGNRNCKVYYAPCPEESLPESDRHFVLTNAASPLWQRAAPKSPLSVQCTLHGPQFFVKVTEPWKPGFVSDDELRKGGRSSNRRLSPHKVLMRSCHDRNLGSTSG